MAGIEIAVEGAVLIISGSTTPEGPPPTITSIPSSNVKVDDKKVYYKQLDITIAGLSDSTGCVQSTPVNASIMPTAENDEVDGELVLRKGDKVVGVAISGQNAVPEACSFTVDVEISDAGQTAVKGS